LGEASRVIQNHKEYNRPRRTSVERTKCWKATTRRLCHSCGTGNSHSKTGGHAVEKKDILERKKLWRGSEDLGKLLRERVYESNYGLGGLVSGLPRPAEGVPILIGTSQQKHVAAKRTSIEKTSRTKRGDRRRRSDRREKSPNMQNGNEKYGAPWKYKKSSFESNVTEKETGR